MRKQRLLWQIFPANLLITLGAMLLVTWYGTSTVRSFYYQQMRDDIKNRALLLKQEIINLSEGNLTNMQEFCRRAGGHRPGSR